ncbi:hypothetical protein P5P86_11730 [Nocardioides sp. BP30]|uniref:hypothetical protein n=1 Tax=Nocardioides sp. BP30 TaxID=3036374 RepID=UPI0024699D26|nr:hypothetical protein [Nocardioides sp. BP30]WGL50634.1 hypothetical protein P5P86_11730 [Nocardioides sp. BP30]
MPRTPAQVLATIRDLARRKVDIGTNDCQLNAHDIYLIGSGAATAAQAYERARYKHPLPNRPSDEQLAAIPLGAWIFWGGGQTISKATGKPSGHVAIWAGRVGGVWSVWSPGAPGAGNGNHWTLVPLTAIEAGWPAHFLLGWTEDNNGVRVPELAPAEPKPKKQRPALVRKALAGGRAYGALLAAAAKVAGPTQKKKLQAAMAKNRDSMAKAKAVKKR